MQTAVRKQKKQEKTMNIEQIWNDYGNLLRRFLLSKVNNPEDAEDLLQDILIKTHKKLGSLKDPKKF